MEIPKLFITSAELDTILVWYETLKAEGGNEKEDDALYSKLEQHYENM